MKDALSTSVVLALLVFTFAACSSAPTQTLDEVESKAVDLVGPRWELISFQSAEGKNMTLPANELYTLRFQTNKELSGRAADCDPYFASYDARDDGAISVGGVSSSLILCGVDSSIPAYFEAIGNVGQYELAGDDLRLGFGGQGVLTYRKGSLE